MDATAILWLGGLFAGTTYLISTYSTSFAFQRPIQTSVLTLLTTGIVLLLSFWLQSYALTQHKNTKTHASRRRNASFSYQTSRPLSQRKTRAAAIAVVVILCVRVEILRRVINNSQCLRQNSAFLIPIGTTLYEQWTSQPTSETVQTQNPARSWKARLIALLLLPTVLSAGLLSVSRLLAASSYAMPHSTYICAHNRSLGWTIPLLQNIGAVLDGVLLVIIGVLVSRTSEEHGNARSMSLLGWIAVASSILLFVSGYNPWITPQYRWYLEDFSGVYLAHTIRMVIAISLTALCGLRVLCWLGVARTSSLFTFIFLYISSITAAWRFRLITYPVSPYVNLFYLTLAGIGLSLTLRTHSSNKFPDLKDLMKKTRFGHRSFVALVILCALPATLWFTKVPQTTLGHPVETLISNAINEHDEWSRQASASTSLNEAAQNYRARYGRDPPPNFDHWYAYAKLHDSLIIDDFDNIYNDILPFWSLPPVKTRQRTLEAIADPWNNIAGIMIRSGTVTVSAGTPDSHGWMLNGTADMIRPFAQWLPDMDLAFNLNDEGRVAIPYEPFQPIIQTATEAFRAPTSTGGGQTFSPFHLRNWPPIPETPITTTRFFERSWHPTWSEFGAIVCPPTSPARTQHAWDLSRTNPSYISPHTYHNYLSNYTLSFSTCHQPDLAHLHGLHMSPAAFKGTYDLVPVFSQSKAGGYSDIRYPSAWNYVGRERTVYAPNITHPDPPFAEKERTLFWRGGTTEGVSAFETGSWQGMARQRMVWLFNNAVDDDGVRHVIHLPTKSTNTPPYQPQGHAYKVHTSYTPALLPPSSLRTHAATNISLHIPLTISRCADSSCSTQHDEFLAHKTHPIDFQTHWRFKYLLDMDGAGFSGRFLPFLRSGSVVMKMGVVREWWEGRVWPWWDFVPCDVRGGEIGGLMAFLGGWRAGSGDGDGDDGEGDEGGEEGSKWLIPPRDDLAEKIATQGQQTANTMLRKVDMEIYMFRLLLEWGRVVDDNRELLGWRGDF